MKPILLLSALLGTAVSPLFADSSTLLSPATPLQWSFRMANSQMTRDGEKLKLVPATKRTWGYEIGVYSDALIRLSDYSGDPAYEKSAEETLGSFIGPDGKIKTYRKKRVKAKPSPGQPVPTPTPDQGLPKVKIPYSFDDVQPGVATLKLYDITHDERYHKAADILRDDFRHHPRTPEGGFWHKAVYPNQMWLDGLYMGEPFYASYAVHFGEPEDFDDIGRQFTIIAAHTYDPKTGLFYHGWDESKKQKWADPQTGTSHSFWGRAIGWYAMALVDVLDLMPKDHPARPALLELVQKVAGGILKYQDPKTGVWWEVTNKRGHAHNYMEASSSSMFVYFLAKAVNHGYLPRTDIPAIRKGYQGMIKEFISMNKDGKGIDLTHIDRVANLGKTADGSYKYYTQAQPIVANDRKGVGPFIMAGIECQKLLGPEIFAQ